MKKLTKLAMMFFVGALALGFTSCSDDDNDNTGAGGGDTPTPTAKTEMQAVVENYVNNVVDPTYADLADGAQQLYDACQTLYANRKAGNLTQADIDKACEAFKTARRFWEQSEAFLYGAATDNEIDPHIDSWPLDHAQLVSALNDPKVIAGIKSGNPAKYIYENNGQFDSVLGFHGLEFVLFRNGANRKLADFTAEYETEEGLTSVKTEDEAAFAAAVSGDLRNMIFLLEYGWRGTNAAAAHISQIKDNASWVLSGTRYAGLSSAGISYGDFVKGVGTGKSFFNTWHETLQNVFIGGCSNICQEVYTQKLGQAYRVATGTQEDGDAGDYIESPYSKRSYQDYQDNIYSIKNSLYGVRGTENVSAPASNSIMALLKNLGYPKYDELNNALNAAISQLETAKKSGKAFIDAPGDAQVKACIDKVQALDDALGEAGSWINKQEDK